MNDQDEIDHLIYSVKITKAKRKRGSRVWYFFKG